MRLLDEERRRPFAWGARDCATFAAAAVLAVTGEDPLADLADRYHDEASALRLLRELGGLEAATTARLGPPLDNVRLARRGDVVLFDAGLGVCEGAWLVCKALEGGTTVRPIAAARQVWPVGWSPT
jgi:hypothetical protein